jgi:hypothetical protein
MFLYKYVHHPNAWNSKILLKKIHLAGCVLCGDAIGTIPRRTHVRRALAASACCNPGSLEKQERLFIEAILHSFLYTLESRVLVPRRMLWLWRNAQGTWTKLL